MEYAVFEVIKGVIAPELDYQAKTCAGDQLKDGWWFQIDDSEPIGPYRSKEDADVSFCMELLRLEYHVRLEFAKESLRGAMEIIISLIETEIRRRRV